MKILSRNTILSIISFLILFGSLSFKYPPTNKNKGSKPNYFNNKNITDGPYLLYDKEKIVAKWIYKNRLVTKTINNNDFDILQKKIDFEFKPEWIIQNKDTEVDYIQRYNNIENITAVSDIHGQFDILVKLLRTHQIIDENYNWTYGNGHLVILGDILDRGPKVTESLWLIYKLEQQAKTAGGKVHFLLGNHELMVLNNDITYINEKYITSSVMMNNTYNHLFSENTFFGKWLSKRPIFVTINDMLFVHAGVSLDFIKNGYTRSETNQLFHQKIIRQNRKTIFSDSVLTFMISNKGPLWYRGYFKSPYLREYQVNHILRFFEIEHIIVGHTTLSSIGSLYHGKIYGIDSNMKNGNYGELLIYKNGKYYRATLSGSLIELN